MASNIRYIIVCSRLTHNVAILLALAMVVFKNRHYTTRFWPGADRADVSTLWLMLATAISSVIVFWVLSRTRRVFKELAKVRAEAAPAQRLTVDLGGVRLVRGLLVPILFRAAILLAVAVVVFMNRNYMARFGLSAQGELVSTLWLMLMTAISSVFVYWVFTRTLRVVNEPVQVDAEAAAGQRIAVDLGGVGLVLGLLVSYLFRPTLFGEGPSFCDWYTEGWSQGFGATIAICGFVGFVLGGGVGVAFGLLRQRSDRGNEVA